MPHTKSLCPRLCPRYAPFWTAHGRLGMHFMCNLRMSSLSRSHSRFHSCSTPALTEPLSAAAPWLCPPPALICVAETFQNFTAWCNIKMPSFYDYAADVAVAVDVSAAPAAAGAAGAILLNFNGIFSSANCRMH